MVKKYPQNRGPPWEISWLTWWSHDPGLMTIGLNAKTLPRVVIGSCPTTLWKLLKL